MINNQLLTRHNISIAKNKEKTDAEIMNELIQETAPQSNTEKEIPPLVKVGNKVRFEDGKRLYNSEEAALNAIKGFHKFQDKREETSQFIHKKTYDELTQNMTPEEIKDYNRSLSGRKKLT